MAPGDSPEDRIEAAKETALTSIAKAAKKALDSVTESEKAFAANVGREQQLRWLHKGFSEQIGKEYELIGARMSWLMAGTAFLFTALALTSAILANSANPSAVLQTLLKIIPVLGLLLTIVVIVGILAAESVIHKRKTDRLKVENELIGILRLSNDDLIGQITRKTLFGEPTVRITVPTTSPRHWFGVISTFLVLALLFGAWLCVSCSVYGWRSDWSCGLCAHFPTSYLTTAQPPDADPSAQLRAHADEYMEALLQQAQPLAYFYQLPLDRHDRFIDNSPETQERFQALEDRLLASLDRMNPAALPDPAGRVFHAKFTEALESAVQQRVCRRELWSISHMSGPTTVLSLLGSIQPVATDEEKSDALARWNAVGGYFDREQENLEEGLRLGYSAPKRVVNRVRQQLSQLTAIPAKEHPFMQVAERAQDDEFTAAFAAILETRLMPAMRAYNRYLEVRYLPRAREALGLHAIPDGRACYRALYRHYTTLDRSPEQVFELGLETVNRQRIEVERLGRELYGAQSFEAAIRKASEDPAQRFDSAEAVQAFYEEVVLRARDAMPEVFAEMPSIALLVTPIPEHEQGTGRSAHYVPGSEDRAARFAFDPTNWASENRGSAELVTVHEGYPGHHMQFALVQAEVGFHPIQAFFSNAAFAEGWARYAEALAEEIDIYRSDAALILRRAWPARGMVADPAMHLLGWSNEQVADFLKASGRPHIVADLDAVLDRMAAIPAQLTAYDSGALEIFALRDRMLAAQGEDFDIKEFHTLVLQNGNVPLWLLKEQVEATLR